VKLISRLFAPLLLCLALLSCATPPASPKTLQSGARRATNPNVSQEDLQSLVAGNTAFATDFYRAVRSQPGNLFYSPYSLSLALAMTYGGARGETATQMADTLHFTLPPEKLHPAFNALDVMLHPASPGQDDVLFQLQIANSLWGQKDYAFLPEFLDLLAQNYGAGMRIVDYEKNAEAARQEINGWVSRETKERIQDLIPSGGVDSSTRLTLVNAIYFKADWLYPFEPNNTRDLPFNRLDGTTIQAKFMAYGHPLDLRYLKGAGFQAVDLPYQGNSVSMLIIVPDAGKFEAFETDFSPDGLQAIRDGVNVTPVGLVLPKFKFTTNFALADTLVGMGMPAAFDGGQADFSGMDGTRNLCIDQVFHKAFVAVDEQGTEAAAASAVVMKESALMLPQDHVVLLVDRPFLFFIFDQAAGAVLFAGRVVDPTQ